VTIGNPDLKPSFENSIRINYEKYKVLTEQSTSFSVNYSTTQNAFSNKSVIDKTGKTTSQSVNVNGNRRMGFSADYGFKLKKPEVRFRPGVGFSTNRSMNYVNGELNETNNNNYNLDLSISQYKEGKYDFDIHGSARYTNSKSSVQQSLKTNYWTFSIRPEIGLYLPFKIELRTDLDINLRQKLAPTDQNNNVVLWNAWVGKKFFKNESLLLKFSANDLLNQNTGFSRNVGANSIAESTYSTIRRYGLVSLVWNFNKMGANSK
jgi:hypothetical protein